MAGLRAAARQLADLLVGPPSEDGPTALPDVAEAAARADAHGPGILRRANRDYDAIAARVMALLTAGRDLSRADLRDAAWCIWTTTPALSDDPRALAAYLRVVIRMDQIRPYRALASSYLTDFRLDRPNLALIARALQQYAGQAGLPWSDAQATYALFDPTEVFQRLADVSAVPAIRPARRLEAIRVGRMPAGSGIELALASHALETLKGRPNGVPLARLASAALWATDDDGRLIDDALAGLATEAMLQPFRGQTPDADIRDAYIDVIVGMIGDPRVEPERWAGNAVNEAIVRRWLGEQSLRMFLEVVAKVAPPEHWSHRRAFWEAIYRASLVDDAWVVFEAEGAIAARRTFGQQVAFARFAATSTAATGGDVGRGMAALILQIGTLRVVDWSHGGPCLIWDTERETGAPDLYRRSYEAARFRKIMRGPETIESHAAQGIFWHSGTEQFTWQDQIAEYLMAARGIRLAPAAYRV